MIPPRDDERSSRYLLGEMPEAERDAFEEEYFARDDAFAELEAVEDDLVDAYSRGQLGPERRARFEERYVSEEGGQRVEFARALRALIEAERSAGTAPGKRRASRWTAWSAGLAAAALAALAFHTGQLRFDLRRLSAENDALQRAASEREQGTSRLAGEKERLQERLAEMEELVADLEQARVVPMRLAPGSSRAMGPIPRVRLERGASRVRFTLLLPSEPARYDAYRLNVETPEGRAVARVPAARDSTRGDHVIATVPADVLMHGHYLASVEGLREGRAEPVADYTFQVVRPD
jgi:hypothetical protein